MFNIIYTRTGNRVYSVRTCLPSIRHYNIVLSLQIIKLIICYLNDFIFSSKANRLEMKSCRVIPYSDYIIGKTVIIIHVLKNTVACTDVIIIIAIIVCVRCYRVSFLVYSLVQRIS